jgi:hypothetical protein
MTTTDDSKTFPSEKEAEDTYNYIADVLNHHGITNNTLYCFVLLYIVTRALRADHGIPMADIVAAVEGVEEKGKAN